MSMADVPENAAQQPKTLKMQPNVALAIIVGGALAFLILVKLGFRGVNVKLG